MLPRRDMLARTNPSTDARTILSSQLRTTPAPKRLAPGEHVGPYRICMELGSGGMSTVYLARARGSGGLHRFVAIKCLRPALADDPELVAGFFDEARITSQIHHGNVCTVIDFDEEDGLGYLVMEYLVGETLAAVRSRIAHADLPPAHRAGIVARILADVAEGLHCAHELRDSQGEPMNVVHRDVSPDNIFLTYDGTAKVVDFGVAAASHQVHKKTSTGVFKGKYAYIQPEVLRGKKPDRRADVWGLGVVAWELLTGQRLFDYATDLETMLAVENAELLPPSTFIHGIPADLDAVIMKALARDPAKRYQTAREFGRELVRFLAEQRLAIGLAELSDFMDRLFPNGRACKRQMFELLDRLDEPSWKDAGDDAHTRVFGQATAVERREIPPGAEAPGPARKRSLRTIAALAIVTPVVAIAAWATAQQLGRASHRPPGAPAAPQLVVEPVESASPDTVTLRVKLVP